MKFEFQNPTRIVFGAGTISQLGKEVRQYGQRALIVTGSGSVKSNGSFDRAADSLHAAGVTVIECTGVEPNPRLSTVNRGMQLAKDQAC
jgi:alcohol dehydrogenase